MHLSVIVFERAWRTSYLREGAVVPKVAFVGEAIADIAKFALLDVLFDGVQGVFFRNLDSMLIGSRCVFKL